MAVHGIIELYQPVGAAVYIPSSYEPASAAFDPVVLDAALVARSLFVILKSVMCPGRVCHVLRAHLQ